MGRHDMLKATWLEDGEEGEEGEERWCVLKRFGHGDDKRLRRELGVLARLRHPNIMPLQAVCKHEGHCFVQLPLYPSDLKRALAGAGELEDPDRLLRVSKLLRGLLEGLHFLHQVRGEGRRTLACGEGVGGIVGLLGVWMVLFLFVSCFLVTHLPRRAFSTATSNPRTCW